MTGEVDGCDFGIGDGDGFRVAIAIEFAAHREAGPGRGGSDQLDDDLMADQRLFILETLWLTFVGLLICTIRQLRLARGRRLSRMRSVLDDSSTSWWTFVGKDDARA